MANARDVLIALYVKYGESWHKMMKAIQEKEDIDVDKSLKGVDTSKLVTILDEDYPQELKSTVRPPFVVDKDRVMLILRIRQLKERVNNEWNEIEKEFLAKKKNTIMNCAYIIAHYEQIVWLLTDGIDEDEGCCPFELETIERMLNYDKRIVEKVFEDWQNYNHPERFNFFVSEDLVWIIKTSFSGRD